MTLCMFIKFNTLLYAGVGSDLAAHHQALVTALNNGHGQVTVTRSTARIPTHTVSTASGHQFYYDFLF